MFVNTVDQSFRRFKRTRDPAALARVFDRTAPELLGLARHLASDEAAAEDLLQSTFVTAMESAEDHDDGRPVLPWLVGILGNHARAARRRARRPVDRDRIGTETLRDPLAEAMSHELEGSLRDKIAKLPEAYRPVLRLYLEHGLEPSEIARTLERPAGTVRSQVARGLETLRHALPSGLAGGAAVAGLQGRGLAAVRETLLQRCGEQVVAGPAVAAGAIGVLAIMNQKLVLSAVTAAAALALSWSVWSGLGDASPQDPTTDVIDRSVQLPVPSDVSDERPPDLARSDVPAAVAKPTAIDTPRTDGRASLRVLVRNASDGSPVAGIAVWLHEFERIQDPDARTDARLTDAEGAVQFEDLAPAQLLVLTDRTSSLRSIELDPGASETVEVVLPIGIRVVGRVMDPHGNPVPDAKVVLHLGSGGVNEVARTDRRGEFEIDGVTAGIRIQARASGFVASSGYLVDGAAGSTVRSDLALNGPARLVVGRVRDADGSPSAGALVAALPREGTTSHDHAAPRPLAVFVRAAQDGSFELDEVGPGATIVFACPRNRDDHAPGRVVLAAGTADAFVEVTLRRGAMLRGRALDAGEPLDRVHVVAWPEQPEDDIGYLLNTFGMRQTSTDADGRYQLRGLVPGAYRLTAYRAKKLLDGSLAIGEGEEHRWDIEVGAGASLKLEIAPAKPTGTALPYWMVRLYRIVDDEGLVFVNAGSANHDGSFDFNDVPPDAYRVVVSCQLPGGATNVVDVASRRIRMPTTETVAIEIEDEEMPRATVIGRLLDASGSPMSNAKLRAIHRGEGLAWSIETFTAEDGRFRLGQLPRAAYSIVVGTELRPVHVVERHELLDDRLDVGDVRVR